jgi:hypothetical protein
VTTKQSLTPKEFGNEIAEGSEGDGVLMPNDPIREIQLREQVEREFAALEQASAERRIGVLDVLHVYGGLEAALRQADAYLALSNPPSAVFSTTSTSNSRE